MKLCKFHFSLKPHLELLKKELTALKTAYLPLDTWRLYELLFITSVELALCVQGLRSERSVDHDGLLELNQCLCYWIGQMKIGIDKLGKEKFTPAVWNCKHPPALHTGCT